MAINAYIGVPGSGKTYEVVKSVLYPAFLTGRRIVTNIEGVEHQKFINFAIEENNSIDVNQLGVIIKVTDDQCSSDTFFPHKNSEDETIAKYGDLICLDEVWRIFPNEKQITDNQKSFIAEHRHFVSSSGITSDLVVINQSVANIPKFIKDRIEYTFKMSKLKSLGLTSRYRIDIYSTSKTTKANLVNQLQQKYDSKFFKLYKSYDGKGKETSIDKRNTIFSRFFIFKMVFAILLLISSSFYLFNKYQETQNVKVDEEVNSVPKDNLKEQTKAVTKEQIKKTDDIELSEVWRIQGELKIDGVKYVILIDKNDVIRYELRSKFIGKGKFIKAVIDGKLVTYYSGKRKAQLFYETNQDFKKSN